MALNCAVHFIVYILKLFIPYIFYIKVRRLFHQINRQFSLIQKVKDHFQHVVVHVYVPKVAGNAPLIFVLIKAVHVVGPTNCLL